LSDIDLMVGREAGQGVQSRGGVWGCRALLAMAKVLLDKSGDYKVRRIVGIG
jgi:hypothetical protein